MPVEVDYVTDDEIMEAKFRLQELHGDMIFVLCVENPPHLKSLLYIDHNIHM